jgi:hypothetical protein
LIWLEMACGTICEFKGGSMTPTRAFGDPDMTPDNFSSFSKKEVIADAAEKELAQLQPVPPASSTTPVDLANVIGAAAVAAIQSSGKIVFHTVGDTGGIMKPQFQFAVADAMALDTASAAATGASFWYHLGDVVYYFGQDQYYFEQFYDPYRNYNAPIFAIPGNHDGVLFSGEAATSLAAFIANFCSSAPANSPDSQGVVRTTMDQPGVYFTLNAPFVKFIGLYSNTGEGGTQGVIASPTLGNAQLDFLAQQLAAAKVERASGQPRALIIATHHPPFTGSPFHVPSPDMLAMIDQACTTAGIWPDLHLSGHSHVYERYTRTIGAKQIPYIVAGVGGFYNLPGLKVGTKPAVPTTPASGTDASGNPLTINVYNDTEFGYLRVTATATSLTAEFITVDPATGKTATGDTFTVNLAAGTVSNSSPAKKAKPAKKSAKNSTSSTTAAKKKTTAKMAAKPPAKKQKTKPTRKKK